MILKPLLLTVLIALNIPNETISELGEKVWKNECGGSIEGLTCWNRGENFASLGIGHFIWYSEGKREGFEETFPALLTFFIDKGVVLPDWLKELPSCPWTSREDFYLAVEGEKMQSLRQLLSETPALQALFIAKRFEEGLSALYRQCLDEEREKIKELVQRLAHQPGGLYALIDYTNFKGLGLSPNERYDNCGWGLLQVLQGMQPSSDNLIAEFVRSAKNVLSMRIQNSPLERGEARWKAGWFNRLDTYLDK